MYQHSCTLTRTKLVTALSRIASKRFDDEEIKESTEIKRTKVCRNKNMEHLEEQYLFHEISLREKEHLKKNPDVKMIDLGQGNTTQPIPYSISFAMSQYALGLSTIEGYSGYGAEEGQLGLRKKIVETFYKDTGITSDEIFVSDGSQCDIARLQMMLGPIVSIAVQDPSYPIFVDSSVVVGRSGEFDEKTKKYKNIVYMNCNPENNFFPDLSTVPRTDVIVFCNPSNPTGHAASRKQLEQLVNFARNNGSILIYDSAYAVYISDDSPKSIFEITGAKEVAIELSTFSKFAGFTGVRLGWTVIPKDLTYACGFPVIQDYFRVVYTSFCGACNIAQVGGLACLMPEGFEGLRANVDFYLENARILYDTLKSFGLRVYGGKHTPFVWVQFPGTHSWDIFDEILDKTHVGTTPGHGFGTQGEDFIRISAFSPRENITEALERMKRYFHNTNDDLFLKRAMFDQSALED